MNSNYIDKIPIAVYISALKYIESKEYELWDNLRIAEYKNKESQEEYERIKKGGCCGFEDYIWIPFDIQGKKYYFGFNYGH